MDRSSSETLSSNSSSSEPNRHRRSAYSKKRSTRINVFPYAPQPVSNVRPLSLSLRLNSLMRFFQPWVVASNADPLKSIESRLLPYDSRYPSTSYYSSSTYTFLPPVLHAGWPIDEDALLQWCTDDGFDRTTYDINDRPVFDYRSTVASALTYLAQRSGLSSFASDHASHNDEVDIFPYIQSTCNHKAPIIVALVSNYDIEGVKKLGTIKNKIYAFGKLLSREGLLSVGDTSPVDPSRSKSSSASSESPKWYLDHKEWQWVPIPKEGLSSSQTSSSAPIDVRLKVKVTLKSKSSRSALGPSNRTPETSKSKPK